MILLSDGTTELALNPDLYWSDEGNWNPVAQAVGRTVTGRLDVQVAKLFAGRPITLEPEDDSSAWMRSNLVEQLRNWAAVPGKQLVLTLRNTTRNVIFRHQDGGLTDRPVVHYRDREESDFYLCVIRLMEI